MGQASIARGGELIRGGDAAGVWRMVARDGEGSTQITDVAAVSAAGTFAAKSANYQAQKDTRILKWSGPAIFAIEGNERDFFRETNANIAIAIRYQVLSGQVGQTTPESWCGYDGNCKGAVDITKGLKESIASGWQESHIKLKCFAAAGADMGKVISPFVIRSEGLLELQILSAALIEDSGKVGCAL